MGAIVAYKNSTVTGQAAVTKYTGLASQDNATVTADQTALTSAQKALTTLQASGTATAQQLASAQTAVTNAHCGKYPLASDQASLSSANVAIVSAQTTLATETNKTLTPRNFAAYFIMPHFGAVRGEQIRQLSVRSFALCLYSASLSVGETSIERAVR